MSFMGRFLGKRRLALRYGALLRYFCVLRPRRLSVTFFRYGSPRNQQI